MMEGRDKTKWIVGMKNGVRVWNRVASELAEHAAVPMAKEDPVMVTEATVPKKKKAAPRKAAAKKGTVAEDKDGKEGEVVGEAVGEAEVEEEMTAVETDVKVEVEKKKTKVVRKKKVKAIEEIEPNDTENTDGEVGSQDEVRDASETDENSEASSETTTKGKKAAAKKTSVKKAAVKKEKGDDAPKKLSTFQMFMKYRMKQLSTEQPSLPHKEKFGMVAAEWKKLSPEDKDAAIQAAEEYMRSL